MSPRHSPRLFVEPRLETVHVLLQIAEETPDVHLARAADHAVLDLSVELVLEAIAFVVDSLEQGLASLGGSRSAETAGIATSAAM